MRHYQVCFTRVGGQGSSDGWQAVNASPELTSEVVANFTRFQNGNIYPPVFEAEDANSQIVTELQSDADFVFLTQVKYRLKDQMGRPSMFAHSYVFPLNEYVQNPQEVLAVSGSNFAFDIDQTKVLCPTLHRTNMLQLATIADELGLNKSNYTTLLQCVYFVLDSKAKNALHIICDCQAETIQKIMTCILVAVPFEFRKKISYSTYENQNGTPKTIIFGRQKNSNGFFVDPATGENNVLTEILLKRWEKYEFMTVAPYNPAANIEVYFNMLENKLSMFGSAQTTSLDLYKIADDLIMDDQNGNCEMSPEMLCKRLNEFLSVPVNHPFIDRQIEIILGGIIESKTILNDILSEKLCRKLERTQDPDLISTGHLYNTAKISRMTVEDGGMYLFTSYENRKSDSFTQIRILLDKDTKGREILNYLYNKLIADKLPRDKESIIAFYEETLPLSDRTSVQNRLCILCYAYLKSTITDKTDPQLLLLDFDNLTRRILQDRPDLCANIKRNIIIVYWNCFKYESLIITDSERYSGVLGKDAHREGIQKAQNVLALIETFQRFYNNDLYSFMQYIDDLFWNKEKYFSNTERSILIMKLQTACLENRNVYDENELDIWLVLAFLQRLENKNPVRFLIDNRIGAMSRFDKAYANSTILAEEKTRERFMEYLEDYMEGKPEGYKTAAEALRAIKEQEKLVKQEEKRHQKKQQQAQRNDPDKKSLFGGLKFPFKKNRNDDDD